MRTAQYYGDTKDKGSVSQCYLQKHWKWCGHVALMDLERWAFKSSLLASQQWKRIGTSSRRGKPIYGQGFRWAVKGFQEHLIFERRVDEFCRAQGEMWMVLAQDRAKLLNF